jgi:transposase
MAGKSPVRASEGQCAALKSMAGGADRAQADRARAILLTLSGWTSADIAEAFGVREDTVRLWRSDFMAGGIDALTASVAAGPAPVKAQAALRVAGPLLEAPVADRTNWTLARLAEEIKRQEGVSISRSQLSKVLRKKGGSASGGRDTR